MSVSIEKLEQAQRERKFLALIGIHVREYRE